MNKVVAIHQPNFFPWLGYFDKIARADVFVFLDDVQYPKTGGGVWSNRVKLLISGEPRWMTAAIDRNFSGTKRINEMYFLSGNRWREKMIKTLEMNYKRHPFFHEAMDVIYTLVTNEELNVSNYNIHAIKTIVNATSINHPEFVQSSEFVNKSTSNELLCDLTLCIGGKTYLCGGGADGYLDERIFEQNNVHLKYQNFLHPTYEQFKRDNFTTGLSVIDAAMNVGWGGLVKQLRAIKID